LIYNNLFIVLFSYFIMGFESRVMKAEDDWTINTSCIPTERTLKFFGYRSINEYCKDCDEERKFYPLPEPSLPEELMP